jgi:hypothetical protein
MDVWGSGDIASFFTSALDGGDWSTSRAGSFTTGERARGTHCIGGWVYPEPVWTLWNREKSLSPLPRIKPRPFSP